MLDYLVTSEVRRRLLKVLWHDGLSGSVSELVRLAGVGFASAHRELCQMEEAGLASSRKDKNTVFYSSNFGHPQAELLKQLLAADAGAREPQRQSRDLNAVSDQDVKLNLVAYGAPLGASGRPTQELSLEETLAAALRLAHKNATVTRAFPVVLFRNLERLNMERLVFFADRLGEKQTLGLFLDLTAQVSGERSLHRSALKLRDHRVKHMRDFFAAATGRYAKELAERNTPPVARRWHFRMNMGLDAFEALFNKFCEDAA